MACLSALRLSKGPEKTVYRINFIDFLPVPV
jgi:hypothetical protein